MLPSPLLRAVDAALEATIVPSFSRVGPAVRSRSAGWTDAPADALAGATVVVTGATSGLGAEIARQVGTLGASVVAVGRNPQRGHDLMASVPGARFVAVDLAERDQVRALADELAAGPRIHALVHNAGALVAERRESTDGLEVTWASMVVAPHLLNRRLADHVDRAIWMSSGGMYLQALDLDDWSWSRRPWDGTRAYAQAKRAQVDLVAHATELGLAPLQVAMHPGWAATPGVDDALPGFAKVMGPLLRTPAEGADTAVWLAAAEHSSVVPGAFYLDRRPRGTVRWPRTATSPADRRRLWDLVDHQAGTAT